MDAAVDIFLPVAAQPSLDTVVSMALDAEAAGYDRLWLPETWGRDAATTLALVARETDRIGLGASVFNVFSRSPALVGQTAATLQEASDGRFRVGVGPSGPAVVERWHGAAFERPLRRTREYVEIVRAVLEGEPVDYDGDLFDLSGFRLRFDPPEPAPPVDAAGMGPKAVELAGRFADGWHALFFTPDGFRERRADLERGAELGGRSLDDDFRTTFAVTCCALADADRARELARRHLAFYVGGMGTFYRDSLARQGHEETANAVFDAWRAGDREAAVEAVGDDLPGDLAAAGAPDDARRALERFAALDGVDAVSVSFPRGATPEEVRETTAALAPER